MSKFDVFNDNEVKPAKVKKPKAPKVRCKWVVLLPEELRGRVSSISTGYLCTSRRTHDRATISFKQFVLIEPGFILSFGVRGTSSYPGTRAYVPTETHNYRVTQVEGKELTIERAP